MPQATGEADPLLFPAPRGGRGRRRNHNRRFRPAARAAGWADHHQWHGLRALFAQTALKPKAEGGMGLSLAEVNRRLGHHSPDFTAKRYAQVFADYKGRASDAARALRL